MPILEAPPSLALTATLATVYTNGSGSGLRKQVRFRVVNIDGVNDANISSTKWTDASASSAVSDVMPINTKVAKLDAVSFTKTMDPGDIIQMNASASGDLVVTPEVIYSEPTS